MRSLDAYGFVLRAKSRQLRVRAGTRDDVHRQVLAVQHPRETDGQRFAPEPPAPLGMQEEHFGLLCRSVRPPSAVQTAPHSGHLLVFRLGLSVRWLLASLRCSSWVVFVRLLIDRQSRG